MSSKSAANKQKPQHKGSASARHGAAAQKANPPVVKKKHGGWLTAMIIIMIVHGIFNTVAILSFRNSAYTNIPPWLYAGAVFDGVATVISAIALWYWRRWGLYLYIAATAVSIALGVIVMRSQIAAFYNIIPLAILGYILTGQKKMQLLV
jgi:hypothetical protein